MVAGEAGPGVGARGGGIAAQHGAGAHEVFRRLDVPAGAGALEPGVQPALAAALHDAAGHRQVLAGEGAVAHPGGVGREVGGRLAALATARWRACVGRAVPSGRSWRGVAHASLAAAATTATSSAGWAPHSSPASGSSHVQAAAPSP